MGDRSENPCPRLVRGENRGRSVDRLPSGGFYNPAQLAARAPKRKGALYRNDTRCTKEFTKNASNCTKMCLNLMSGVNPQGFAETQTRLKAPCRHSCECQKC